MNAKVQLILELKERIKAGLSSAKKYVNENVKEMKDKLASLKTTHIETFKAMGDQIPGFSSVMGLISNPYVLATAAVLALGAAYYKTVQMAADWEKGMAKINVTAQLTKKELASLSRQVLEIGANNVTPLEDVPDAFNKIISAGLDVKTSLASLDPILKAAKAGFADVGTVAAATVSVMNSTGIMNATEVLDVLFATVNKGNAEFSNIAQYLPRIIPMANAAGISFKDMAGAFAYLTAEGFRSEQAATGLENAFKSFSNPATVKGLKSIGVNVYDTHGKMKTLLTIIGDLKKQLGGLSDRKRGIELGKVNFDIESKAAIFSMMGDYNKLKDIIDFTNNSQGQLNQSIANSETPMDVWNIVSNKVKEAMIGIGETGLPMMKQIGQGVLDTIQYFKDLYAHSTLFRDIIKLIGVTAKVSFYMMIMPMKLVWNILQGIGDKIGELGKALGVGTGSFESFYLSIKPYLLWVWDIIKQIGRVLFDLNTGNVKGIWDDLKNAHLENIAVLRFKVEKEERENAQKAKDDAFAGVKGDTGKPGKPGKLDNSGADSVKKITEGGKQVRNITVNIDAFNKGGINVSETQGLKGMSVKDIEKWFNEMLMRAIINLEANQN